MELILNEIFVIFFGMDTKLSQHIIHKIQVFEKVFMV